MSGNWLQPRWMLPAGVEARLTTRGPGGGANGGGAYGGFNLAAHVGDGEVPVADNRRRLLAECAGLREIQWLSQVHGADVVRVQRVVEPPPSADAAITGEAGLGCAVLTADCLPVLICDREGRQVAAAHAGWRGLLRGVLAETVAAFESPPEALRAWLGPCIRQSRFEVGPEVREQFLRSFSGLSHRGLSRGRLSHDSIEARFRPALKRNHYLLDLAGLARDQLQALGLSDITDSGLCTVDDPRFYSYRRDGTCGRFASLIYRSRP